MKSYQGRDRFSGNWDEDINGSIEVFEALSKVCMLSENDMLRGLPVMLTGDALAYYSSNVSDSQTYPEALQRLINWYTFDEQRSRLLQEWHTLSKKMRQSPEKSEIHVFRSMCTEVSKLQRQLDTEYHKDIFLRDQLVRCADTPEVVRALRERMQQTAREATQRIAALLSSEPRSASSYVPFSNTSDMASEMVNLAGN